MATCDSFNLSESGCIANNAQYIMGITMNIIKKIDESKLVLELEGRLDTMTAPQLEKELEASLSNTAELVLDMENLDYISSAGLRVLLGAQKQMNQQGSMELHHVCEEVQDVFDMTGFSDILTIV